jgi:prostaglandin-H2 D-isomerase / glutathione transferase
VLKESGRLPFEQLPILTVDGVTVTQSAAILRYCGRLSGLYPRGNDAAGAAVDEVLGVAEEFARAMYGYRGMGGEAHKAECEEYMTVSLPRLLTGLEKAVLAKSRSETWLCGDALSIADLAMYSLTGNIVTGNLEHAPPATMASYPRVLASYNGVHRHAKVKAWNDANPGRGPFVARGGAK